MNTIHVNQYDTFFKLVCFAIVIATLWAGCSLAHDFLKRVRTRGTWQRGYGFALEFLGTKTGTVDDLLRYVQEAQDFGEAGPFEAGVRAYIKDHATWDAEWADTP